MRRRVRPGSRAPLAFMRVFMRRRSREALAPERAAPGLFPVVAELVGLAAVGLGELVRDLEDGEHQAAFGTRPGLVLAAGRAPDELAGLAFALAADEAAFEHIGLLDQHVLGVRPVRARCAL